MNDYQMLVYGIEEEELWYQDEMNAEEYSNFLSTGELPNAYTL